ncbi:MAG: hypothetical protein ABSE82_12540 [Nitrososphaerales archaeon]|jgi:hypothetical protein
MVSETLATNTGQFVNEPIRPTKVAIVHGSSITDPTVSHDEIHDALNRLFSPLNVRVFSVLELSEVGISDLFSSRAYDVIGLLGEADEFGSARKRNSRFHFHNDHAESSEDTESILLSFAPRTRFKDVRNYLTFSDAVVLCEAIERNWPLEVSRIVYHFFESLVVPSMLNVDVADVKRIAKGVGLAFNVLDDNSENIIAKLPKDCFVASSAILHFSCKDDVRLGEIHTIAKSIALKKSLTNTDSELSSQSDARKVIRKVNVKMGIRIVGDNYDVENKVAGKSVLSGFNSPAALNYERRINMTAILFGI